jgi:hypothetical protein
MAAVAAVVELDDVLADEGVDDPVALDVDAAVELAADLLPLDPHATRTAAPAPVSRASARRRLRTLSAPEGSEVDGS